MSDTTPEGCRALMVEMLDDNGLEATLAALSGALRFKALQIGDGYSWRVLAPWEIASEKVATLMVDTRYLKI